MPRVPKLLRFLLLLLAALTAGCASPAVEAPPTDRSTRGSSALSRPDTSPPAQPTLTIDPARGTGSDTAPLAIVEFGDYQCPYCRAFHVDTLPKLAAEYIRTGKVRYFHLDFPLRHHAQALPAALAAHCAGAQDRYWGMQGRLYEEQARLGEPLYRELARQLALDPTAFDACRASPAARAAVEQDILQARRLGVRVTPTFVLGHIEGDRIRVERMAAGARAYDTFVQEIEALMR